MFSHIKRHSDPELRYSAKGKCFRSYDPETKKCTDLSDEPMIVDLGTVRHGWELLATGRKREIALVYVNEPLPPQPSPDHQMVGAVRVVVASLGRCTIIVDSDSMAAAFTALHEEYVGAAEAVEGLLPIVRLVSENALALEIVDWEPRSEQFLGDRILPLPTHRDIRWEVNPDLPA
jgi:hypothetical protein